MKKLILIYIGSRSLIAALYKYNLLGLRLTDIAGFSFALILLLYGFRQLKNRDGFSIQFYFNLFILWALISSTIVFVIYPDANAYVIYKQFFKILNCFVAFSFFPVFFKTEKDINLLLGAFMINTIYPALQMLGQYAFGSSFLGLNSKSISEEISMLEGVYGNHGYFAIVAWTGAIAIIMKFYQVSASVTASRFLWFGLFFFYISMGFLTFSRTVSVLMVVILLAMVLVLPVRKSKSILIIFLLVLTGFIYSPVFDSAAKGIKTRSEREMQVWEGKADISLGFHGRIGRWQDNLDLFIKNYTLPEIVTGTDIMIGPHGDYFYWLFSFGVIGVTIYLWLLLRLLQRIRNIIKYLKRKEFLYYYARGCLTALFIWLIMAVVTNPSMIPDYGYFIMGNIGILIYNSRSIYEFNKLKSDHNAG